MTMIQEEYVSFETAKLLKEKGFDEHCFCIKYPLPEGGHHNIILPNLLNNSMIPFTDEYKFCRYKEDFITIPTLQMAMKWLREVHNLCIEPYRTASGYLYTISKIWTGSEIYSDEFNGDDEASGQWTTYEKACEAAIKYCLEHLIK